MKSILAIMLVAPCALLAQGTPRTLMPIDFSASADAGWLRKTVHARQDLRFAVRDSLTFTGTGVLTIIPERIGDAAKVEMRMFRDSVAPTRNRLSSVHLRRNFAGQDWSAYNRLAIWMRPVLRGFTHFPVELLIRNAGAEKVPDRYYREGIHYLTLLDTGWTRVVWEIDPLPRDRVMSLEFNYWMNKMIPAPGDSVAFLVGGVELERVDPDVHTGWQVGQGRVAYSHTGYDTRDAKTAIVGVSANATAELVDSATRRVVLSRTVAPTEVVGGIPVGTQAVFDFSEVTRPGTYFIRAGGAQSRPFRIGDDVWERTIWKSLNFLYGNRCGANIPGVHPVDHRDWFATLGRDSIVMNGGWHDAGDLSQGIVNTGELTYALFELAERLERAGRDPALVARVLEEATWGLDWVMKVRFPGGYRMHFAPHNLWTDNVKGTADDRSREAKNNPNANYVAAAALAKAAQVLRRSDPALAARALRMAREDWEHAIAGVESPATRHTPAFAATQMELASIGITASVELFRATGEPRYADTAAALARVVSRTQQRTPVGSAAWSLSGFFYGDTLRDTLFHQFHRGNDQAATVAMAQLLETFPAHRDRDEWDHVLRRHLAYQKRITGATAPWLVHPAYLYRETDDVKEVPDSGALHNATREAYREMVRAGTAVGGGWYLRAFPVWFARRGNYGVLLSQAKALSAAGRLLRDSVATSLARTQLQWVVGRNPFAQSTLFGEGYDWHQQYSVSSGDFVGTLPVGMQSRGHTDLPYWPAQNMYVYKEVWVHSTARWLWVLADLVGP